jgi:hypothetical protein
MSLPTTASNALPFSALATWQTSVSIKLTFSKLSLGYTRPRRRQGVGIALDTHNFPRGTDQLGHKHGDITNARADIENASSRGYARTSEQAGEKTLDGGSEHHAPELSIVRDVRTNSLPAPDCRVSA